MSAKALILTDGKAGHENQSKALARMLGLDFELAPVSFRFTGAKALSYLLDNIGVRTQSLFRFVPQPSGASAGTVPEPAARPAVVIGTGSGTFYAAKTMARKLGAKCAVVLYPRGYSTGSFDCILAPAFDNPPPAGNTVELPMNLVANDAAFYERGEAEFLKRHTPSGRPAVAVIVGGPNKCSTMTAGWMKGELDRLFADASGCEKWVTTSRRTPPDVEKIVDSYPWDYKLIYSRDTFNPIPAFVKLAGRLYVTAESTGMLSEACTCGAAEVYVLDNLKPGGHKFRRFVENLRAGGYVEGARKADVSSELQTVRSLLGLQ
ncbi:MAG: mitochondrial fission ELM1 family protein [Kiritimatiellae bacterium]|nr:mitochondrial fission ELM1 family protein [Kiritimatiellia bacterium]